MSLRSQIQTAIILAMFSSSGELAFADAGKAIAAGAKAVAGKAAQKKAWTWHAPYVHYVEKKDACAVSNTGINAAIRQVTADLTKMNTCFDPEKDPDIKKYYYHNAIQPIACNLYETDAVMHRMHKSILAKSKKFGMDPRIAYIRMLGESQGNPFAQYGQNGNKCPKLDSIEVSTYRAFGLFQFLGAGYKMPKSYAQEVLEKMKANEKLSANVRKGVREVQVDYFFDNYVAKYAAAAKYTKCKKDFKDFTNLQKLAYLGAGNCLRTEHSEEVIMNNKSYISTGAKRLYLEMKNGRPLCETK